MRIHIYLDGVTAPVATTELPDNPGELARGRNGWFRPRQITIWRGVRITVAVRSRRQADNAPIQLQLAPDAAHALGSALLLAAAPADPDEAGAAQSAEHTEVT